jgi:23S rRNA (pseudouridine1915-N3)-methyltransferase
MEIILLVIGPTKEKYIREGLDFYESRLKKYSKFKISTVSSENKILEFLKKGDKLIILDRKGTLYSSESLSSQFQKWMNSGPKRLIFATGDAYGFKSHTLVRADYTMSLGPMTYPHDLARLIFLEQLYRSWTILGGEPYHHG